MKNGIKTLILLILTLSLVLAMAGCSEEEVAETTAPPETTEPVETVEPTEPVELPEETTEPENVLEAGKMQIHSKGKNGDDGIYFTMEPNDIPVDTSWKTEFKPATYTTILLYRDGETIKLGNTMTGMIIKFSETEYYLKLAEWNIGKHFPIRDGDVLLVDGIFRNSTEGVSFRIDPTYILVSEGLVFFSDEYPDENAGVQVIYTSAMTSHPNGKTSTGIYATMEENAIPADDSWVTEYKPTTENAVQLIRNGTTYNLGNKAAGMMIKYSATEYYLKLEEWIIKDLYPIRDGDIVVVNGKFANSGTATVFSVKKTYISIQEGLLKFSTEYPSGDDVIEAIPLGQLSGHPNGIAETGIYFSAEPNDVTVDDSWATEFYPANKEAVKLIRDGQTYTIGNPDAGAIIKYGETDYYLKLEQWIYKDYFPFGDGDILVLEGKFLNAGVAQVFEIGKTYISLKNGMLYFSTEYPSEDDGSSVIQTGTMTSHPNGMSVNGIYFSLPANDIPVDSSWATEYTPAAESCIKLIRGDEAVDIAIPLRGTILKFGETEYFLKTDSWAIGSYHPLQDGDILLVEGNFLNAGTGVMFAQGKTYISISGGMAYFSEEYPEGPVGPTQIQGGTMSSHPNGWNSDANGGLYFTLNANDAPYASGWSVRYTPVANTCVKLIRDGATYDVANTGAEMLVKYSETEYYLEFWPISQKPIVEGDVLVVEGSFVNASNNVVLTIEKTYITIENGQPVFSGTEPEVIVAGVMQPHGNGWNSDANDGLYFTLSANEVPYDGWNVEYAPTAMSVIKLIRDGQTYNIGLPGRGTIVKFSDTEYYLKLGSWPIGEYAPIAPGDQLILEGNFTNEANGVTFAIGKSVITVGDNYQLTFGETPSQEKEPIEAGLMQSHSNGWNTQSNKGLYFSLAANEIPYADDWTKCYYPVSTGAIKLVRDGQTVDLAQTDREYIVKYGESDYYLKLEKWTIGDYYPIVPGDLLMVEGRFINELENVEFNITKTYITVGDDYILTFSDTQPEDTDSSIPAGPMTNHPVNGWNNDGLYGVMPANAAHYDEWYIEYTPAEPANYQLVRNGQTVDIGIPGRGTLVKFDETGYYLKFGWCVGDYANTITVGDRLIVSGKWCSLRDNTVVMDIAETVITIGEGYVLTFDSDAEVPEAPDTPAEPDDGSVKAGAMAAHSVNGWTATGGLYFTMAENTVPYDDWNVRYTPTAESNVKLIRGGMTYDVGHTARETIVKFSDTEYYLEFWTLGDYKPILAGDMLVVEGNFVNATNGVTMNISKTTVTFNADGTATFSAEGTQTPETPDGEEPAQSGLPMLPWSEKAWNTGSNGGFWFTMEENDIPADETWVLEYTPVSEDVLKLVRGGQTINIGIPDRGTLVKVNDAEYYLKLEWNIGDYANTITVGDVLIVEGDFTNATNGVTFTVAKTTITVGENYVLTFESEAEETPEAPEPDDGAIQAGTMAKHSSNYNSTNLFFTMAENAVPYHLTKAIYKPVSADVIKLVRDGVTYDIGDPNANTVQKTTKSNYKFLLASFGDKMPLQEGDLLIVEGKFNGGNTTTDVVVTFHITKTYISIVDGTAVFSEVDPRA